MYAIGIDIGYSTIKIAVTGKDKSIILSDYRFHRGRLQKTLVDLLEEAGRHIDLANIKYGAITGSGADILKEMIKINEVTAIVEGARIIDDSAKSIVEIGAQSAIFISGSNSPETMDVSINSGCSAGTGSFLEEQVNRLGIPLESYGKLALSADEAPRIAGRCSVFAKSDIIHHQQEGFSIESILKGLANAVASNYKSMIVKSHKVTSPVLFVGGVMQNESMVQSLIKVLGLSIEDVRLPKFGKVISAIGASQIGRVHQYEVNVASLMTLLNQKKTTVTTDHRLKPLMHNGTSDHLGKHVVDGNLQDSEGYLGIDIGSTSTNIVVINREGKILFYDYLRTAGDPVKAVRSGLEKCVETLGKNFKIKQIATTGSGRYLIGKKLEALVIKDEITAQATATLRLDPEVDTIFEIGGQDSKYIYLGENSVKDFKMNKICAAGTGAFIEEQASKLGVDLQIFSQEALKSERPLDLGERCTVFIESTIMDYLSKGADIKDVAAGLCYAIAKNYLNKVVGHQKVGNKISLQGGIAYNQGVLTALRELTGKEIVVLPFFSVSGAFGVANLCLDQESESANEISFEHLIERLNKKQEFMEINAKQKPIAKDELNELFMAQYSSERVEGQKIVGIPRVLFLHKLFPAFNTFFRELGFNTLITEDTDEHIVALSQDYPIADACYPIKLVHGHVSRLIELKVDYIFLPNLMTMKHEVSKSRCNYGCVFMQSLASIVESNMKAKLATTPVLAPTLSLQFGKGNVMQSMVELGKSMGFTTEKARMAIQKGMMNLQNYIDATEAAGKNVIENLKEEEKTFVIISRAYGVKDPILNMGVMQTLKEMGHRVITLSHLPAHDIDISKEHGNMFWSFGEHMISGAQIIRQHPNLYAIYLTNHGCGPDTIITKFIEEEMGEKPYLHLEVDEHASKVGIVTRIEAFLNSLKAYESTISEKNLTLAECAERIEHKKANVHYGLTVNDHKKWVIPNLYPYSQLAASFLRKNGHVCDILPMTTSESLAIGLSYTTTKEPYSLTALIGDVLMYHREHEGEAINFIYPTNEGAEVDGQYHRVLRTVLDREGYSGTRILSPFIEDLFEGSKRFSIIQWVLFAGDLILLTPVSVRNMFLDTMLKKIESNSWCMDDLYELSTKVKHGNNKKNLLVIGELSVVFHDELNHQIIRALEKDDFRVIRNPLSEYFMVLWQQHISKPDGVRQIDAMKVMSAMKKHMEALHKNLGTLSPFTLLDKSLDHYPSVKDYYGSNAIYRLMKMMNPAPYTDGILHMASMYENTFTILNMIKPELKEIPVLDIALEQTVNEQLKMKLEAFKYYISRRQDVSNQESPRGCKVSL